MVDQRSTAVVMGGDINYYLFITVMKLITLSSSEGQKLLEDCKVNDKGCYDEILHHCFAKQVGRSSCGVQSAGVIFNGAYLKTNNDTDWKQNKQEDLPFCEDKMFAFEETKRIITKEKIDGHGMTLQQLGDLLSSHTWKVQLFPAGSSNVDEFRKMALDVLMNSHTLGGVIVNYHMAVLGQSDDLGGHFSPLGAYHCDTDRFLILDTWYTTEEPWAKTEDLFNAMNTIDKESGSTRGFCVATKTKENS